MKKILFLLTVLVSLLCLGITLHASAHDGTCACGREIAEKDTRDSLLGDCLGCGRNYSSCSCETCWCSAPLTRTETAPGITVVSCNDCGLPCEECSCRDRVYYQALLDVDQGVAGGNIPNPDNGAVIAFALLIPFAGFFATYFTVYRRRSSTRTRKNRSSVLEEYLDQIDREPDAGRRYALAKALEETKRGGDLRIPDRECKTLCLRKNELLGEAVEEDWIRSAVRKNLRRNRTLNEIGFLGAVEAVDRMWDFEAKDFSADRKEISGETVAQSLVKWDTKEPGIALFEAVTPLNGDENNLLHPGSNTTRFGVMIFDDGRLMNRKFSPESTEAIRETLARILPDTAPEALLDLPQTRGDICKPVNDLPGEATVRRMGEKNRFPGGMAK